MASMFHICGTQKLNAASLLLVLVLGMQSRSRTRRPERSGSENASSSVLDQLQIDVFRQTCVGTVAEIITPKGKRMDEFLYILLGYNSSNPGNVLQARGRATVCGIRMLGMHFLTSRWNQEDCLQQSQDIQFQHSPQVDSSAKDMSQDGLTNTKHAMAVIAVVEEWESLKSLLQNSSGDKCFHSTFSSPGSKQVCDLAMDSLSISLHYKDFKEDMPDKAIGQVIDGCFKSCEGGISAFLLLIQGGYYTKKERRMVEILHSHFGAEALRFLVILSVEDGKVTDTLDDTLLDLINVCEGRYCRITSSTANGGLHALVEMVNNVRSENGKAGYTEAMLEKSKRRSVEDSAMNMLKKKAQEAEEKEQVFMEKMRKEEKRRAKEMEDLKIRHAEERRKEAEEKKQHERDRENIEEAMMSHRSILQLQAKAPDGDKTKKMSVVLLGLTGSGKSSALHLILNRGANLYSLISSCHDQTQPTISCEKKEIFTGGKRLVLVDTPELWDEDGVENTELVKDCLALALPGPQVFLLVLLVGRFTQGESEMLGHVQRIFGREVAEHAIVLFVHFDSNQPRPFRINDYVARAHPALQDLVRKCGSRFYELNVTRSQSALSYSQVRELLSGIDKLVASHGDRAYTVKRFSLQELQQRNNVTGEKKEGAYLLGDS